MLDKLKLFKSGETRPAPSTGKRTSSSSGVSSARSERSDSSISLEHSSDVKPLRNNVRLKQQRSTKSTPAKSSPGPNKKEITKPKTAQDVEKHANKVANLSTAKTTGIRAPTKPETPKSTVLNVPTTPSPNTGIPKPTAAVKGTSKPPRDPKPTSVISRESSNISITKSSIPPVSPIKNDKDNQLSESSHSASTGQHSNSSESSVIYKPSSESGSEAHNVIPNRKEPVAYISDVTTEIPRPPIPIPEIKNEHKQNMLQYHIREGSQGDDESISVEPMMPLLRGYCSTLNLPSRRTQYTRIPPDVDYCEITTMNGYLSDGEMLRNPPRETCDGYMSEGGSVLYARRLQTIPPHLANGYVF